MHVEPTSLAQRGVAADDDIVDLAVDVGGVVVDMVHRICGAAAGDEPSRLRVVDGLEAGTGKGVSDA